MFKPKVSLHRFSAAIAQSVYKANEQLEQDHKSSYERYKNDPAGAFVPPPPLLMISGVKVKFSGSVSGSDYDKEESVLLLDLNKPDGNFSAELDFAPFPKEMQKVADMGQRKQKPDTEPRGEQTIESGIGRPAASPPPHEAAVEGYRTPVNFEPVPFPVEEGNAPSPGGGYQNGQM